MADKLNYMKSGTQKFKELCRPSRFYGQPKFEDRFLKAGPKFKHTWAQMAHMHDLRVWTLAYAPGKKNNIRRITEIHYLNQEMWYNVYIALWKRLFAGVGLYFFFTKIAKERYMKKATNTDTHDANWRETTAHM